MVGWVSLLCCDVASVHVHITITPWPPWHPLSQNADTQETPIHVGIKGTRVTWCGDTGKLITTGFSKMSDRQYMLWDMADLSAPIKQENLDTSSGILIPSFDNDTKMLYLAGKG